MSIEIKPENKGKFTAKAKKAHKSVAGYAAQVLKEDSRASAATKKQANFARNAAKWNHKKHKSTLHEYFSKDR